VPVSLALEGAPGAEAGAGAGIGAVCTDGDCGPDGDEVVVD
jgi:hypothetical protein